MIGAGVFKAIKRLNITSLKISKIIAIKGGATLSTLSKKSTALDFPVSKISFSVCFHPFRWKYDRKY